MTKAISSTAKVRPAAEPAWEELQAVLMREEPNCDGDARYIADPSDLDSDERADMRSICRTCPVLAACTTYGRAERPRAGWWPGHNL